MSSTEIYTFSHTRSLRDSLPILDRTTPDVFDQFARAVRDMPEVLECHMVAGGFDYLIKVRVRDMEAYRQFLGASLTSLPGVRETHTYAVMEEVKHSMRDRKSTRLNSIH